MSNSKGNTNFKAHELLAKAKRDAKLVKSKLLIKRSEDSIEDNLFSIIAGLTSQLAFVKEKLTFYQKVKGAPQGETLTQLSLRG